MPDTNKICPECGKPVEGDPRKRYCSRDCQMRAGRRRHCQKYPERDREVRRAWYRANFRKVTAQARARYAQRKYIDRLFAEAI